MEFSHPFAENARKVGHVSQKRRDMGHPILFLSNSFPATVSYQGHAFMRDVKESKPEVPSGAGACDVLRLRRESDAVADSVSLAPAACSFSLDRQGQRS